MKPGRKPSPLSERIYRRLVADSATGCLNWTGLKNHKGYGRLKIGKRFLGAHRIAYELVKGAIPQGLVIDHLCRNPACCNPDHLQAVTTAENTRRGNSGRKDAIKTHCPQGHPYSAQNTYVSPAGHRHCRACKAVRAVWKRRVKRRADISGDGPRAASDGPCQSEGGEV